MQALLGVKKLHAPRCTEQGLDSVVQAEGGRQVQQSLASVILHGYVVVILQKQLQGPAFVKGEIIFWSFSPLRHNTMSKPISHRLEDKSHEQQPNEYGGEKPRKKHASILLLHNYFPHTGPKPLQQLPPGLGTLLSLTRYRRPGAA